MPIFYNEKFIEISFDHFLNRMCCNEFMVNNPESNGLQNFPWFLWAQRSQMMFSPCFKKCKNFNPFAGRYHYLLNSSTQECNQCLIKNIQYPWHMFTRTRMEDAFIWKVINEKIDTAESVYTDAKTRGWI